MLRDVELFVGYDPTIDDGKDDEITPFDRQRVMEVIERTRQFMRRGQNPKLVLLHEKDGGATESVGDIVAIRGKDIGGGHGIVGDIVMSRSDFEEYVSNNRYPRRSAEIWPDGYMSEVALLGRQTPRRPLPDTRFERGDSPIRFERPVNDAPLGRPAMTTTDMTETLKLIAKRLERLEMASKSKYMSDDDEKDENEKDDEDEKDEMEEKDDDVGPPPKNESAGDYKKKGHARDKRDRLEMERRLRKLELQNTELNQSLRQERFGRDLDDMESDGYAIREHREMMLNELGECSNDSQAASKIEFWRASMTRHPLNVRLPMEYSRTTSAGSKDIAAVDPETRKLAASRARDRASKGQGNYADLLAEELEKPQAPVVQQFATQGRQKIGLSG